MISVLVIILLVLISLLLPYNDALRADCVGGYEDANADGTCSECPSGKASGNQEWKDITNTQLCTDVPMTCGAGQILNVYSGGYYYCQNAPNNEYCLNGRCIVDWRYSNYKLGQNDCPSPYTRPKHNELLITDTESSSDPKNKVSSSSSGYTYTEPAFSYYDSVTYKSYDTTGAVMCTAEDGSNAANVNNANRNTWYCPPGTGTWGSGVYLKSNPTTKMRDYIFTYNSGSFKDWGCYNCTAGTYQSGTIATGSRECQPCASNSYSPTRAVACTANKCAAGYGFVTKTTYTYSTEEQECTACKAGYYNDGTFLECRQCPG